MAIASNVWYFLPAHTHIFIDMYSVILYHASLAQIDKKEIYQKFFGRWNSGACSTYLYGFLLCVICGKQWAWDCLLAWRCIRHSSSRKGTWACHWILSCFLIKSLAPLHVVVACIATLQTSYSLLHLLFGTGERINVLESNRYG